MKARDHTRGAVVRDGRGKFTQRTTAPKKLVSGSRDPQKLSGSRKPQKPTPATKSHETYTEKDGVTTSRFTTTIQD